MKTLIKFFVLVLFTSPLASLAADIGIVDNNRILEEYSGAKDAQKKVIETKEKLQSTFANLSADLEKSLQDKKLSEAQKLQKRKAAQETLEQEKKKLDQMVDGMRANIENKIQKAIQDEAKAQGLGVVAAKNSIFYGGKDITDAVLVRLKK
jgi:Skp family chaperone for outer membrane proteins